MRKTLVILISVLVIVSAFIYARDRVNRTGTENQTGQVVVSLGQDLSASQKDTVINYFNSVADVSNAQIIAVSNQEERRYLQGKIDEKLIGTRAISSAYVKINKSGGGIDVKTNHITWVTPFMYANALLTAGVNDATVVVTAPFDVSGTAALTGIIKAFETATGKRLSENAKQTANQEVAETSKLGQKIGQDKAGKIIYEVKRQVVEKNISDPEEIRRIIIRISGDLNVKLSDADVQRIVDLMQNLNRLNISISKLNQQLNQVQKTLKSIRTESDQARGFIQRLIDFIYGILARLGLR